MSTRSLTVPTGRAKATSASSLRKTDFCTQPQSAALSNPLLDSPVWPMRMAFFPTGSSDPLPEFEMSLAYHPNGVAEDIEQIFKTFSLRGKLESIEMIPHGKC